MTTNAQLASQITSALQRWNGQLDQLAEWLAGDPQGGPNLDGRYPLTDASGETELYLSLPAILSQVSGPAVSAIAAQLAAGNAETAAEAAKQVALAAQAAAVVARTESTTLKNQTSTMRDDVAANWANVGYTAGLVAADRATVVTARDQVVTDADASGLNAADALSARVGAEAARNQAQIHADRINILAAELADELRNLKACANELSPLYWQVYYKPFITGFKTISVPYVRSDGEVWTIVNRIV